MTFRLALVEDDGLERVVDKLLPALLLKLDPSDGVMMGKVMPENASSTKCIWPVRLTRGLLRWWWCFTAQTRAPPLR